jgi:hypothetical protein
MQMDEENDGFNDELGMGAAEMAYMSAPKQMVIGGTALLFIFTPFPFFVLFQDMCE